MICFPRSSRLVVIVPVSIPNVAVSVRSFSSIAQASRVSPFGSISDRIAASSRPGSSGLCALRNRRGFSYFLFLLFFLSRPWSTLSPLHRTCIPPSRTL